MRFLRCLCSLVFAFSVCVIVFSGVCIDAVAATVPSGGYFLSESDTLAFIGNSIEVTYWDGSNYSTTTALYDTVVECNSETSEFPSGFPASANGVDKTKYLRYSIPNVGANNNISYTTFHLQPTYSIFDTTMMYTCFAMSYGASTPSTTYQSPQANFYIGGSIHHFENSNVQSNGSTSRARLNFSSSVHATYIPISFSSQSTFSAYAVDCAFYGNGGSGSRYFFIMCPYISTGSSADSGTFTTVSTSATGSTGDINVNVDLEETNGLLDSILTGISGIGDTLIHVFVPTDTQILDFKDDLGDLLDDTFSGIPETADILDDVRDTIADSSPVSQINFPAVSVPNTHFSKPQKTVNLNPDSDLLDFIKLGFDLLATCLFINLVRLKIDEIIHGKVVVESESVGVS